ncbi:DUF2971 domain-containing protein [Pseudocolwellia agarivorans]|uniref:DUF2971 domain-containing protein n=1 Tax=Pseudocolwellia agarivorans TaxID=1911682 RepID=UPI0009855943|nr:DUF2971 domain-containing protein [Pseudocolwellia agarivorans]
MSLYKYVSIDNLVRILDGEIRFTQPSAFNDPFELLPEINLPDGMPNQKLNIKFDVMAPARIPMPYELPHDFESATCNDETARNIRKDLDESIGILCLTQNPKSVLMWSHYAEEYSGAMIEFDSKHDFFEGEIEIDYRDHRPIKDFSFYVQSEEAVRISELCIKSKDWEYEQEVRIVRGLNNCHAKPKPKPKLKYPIYVMDIPLECIKSVTFGERTSIDKQKLIFNKVKETNIGLWLSAISNWGFNFRSEIIKFNKPISELNPVISSRSAHLFLESPGKLGEMARWQLKNNKFSKLVNNIA